MKNNDCSGSKGADAFICGSFVWKWSSDSWRKSVAVIKRINNEWKDRSVEKSFILKTFWFTEGRKSSDIEKES